MKILHILNHSFPHLDGYSVRSHNIIEFQRKSDLKPVVVTSPQHEPPFESPVETIEQIRYYRTHRLQLALPPVLRELAMMAKFRRRIEDVVAEERPTIIHAHSPCHWGIVSSSVAKSFGIPFVYEIRSFWEDGIIDQGVDPRWSVKYHATKAMENTVVRRATRVVTIANGLKQDLVERGHRADKIDVVSNGVEAAKFTDDFSDDKGDDEFIQLAYIGSLYPWEGVDTLIESMVHLQSRMPGARLRIVGDGVERERLESLARQLNLDVPVEFTGRVSHDVVAQQYRSADICVYPRKSSRTTELVTPLKPLEAMAMGKAIIASRVGGLQELLAGGEAEFFEPGNAEALAQACVNLVAKRETWPITGNANKEFVFRERSWASVLNEYVAIYRRACSQFEKSDLFGKRHDTNQER